MVRTGKNLVRRFFKFFVNKTSMFHLSDIENGFNVMNVEKIFRCCILVNITLYSIVLILPFYWSELYSSEVIERIVWSNAVGSILYVPTIAFYAIAALYFVSLFGLFFYERWAKYTFLVLTLVVLLMGLGQGVFSQGPLDAFLNQALSLLDGFVLAFVFFSGINQKFSIVRKS